MNGICHVKRLWQKQRSFRLYRANAGASTEYFQVSRVGCRGRVLGLRRVPFLTRCGPASAPLTTHIGTDKVYPQRQTGRTGTAIGGPVNGLTNQTLLRCLGSIAGWGQKHGNNELLQKTGIVNGLLQFYCSTNLVECVILNPEILDSFHDKRVLFVWTWHGSRRPRCLRPMAPMLASAFVQDTGLYMRSNLELSRVGGSSHPRPVIPSIGKHGFKTVLSSGGGPLNSQNHRV
jgi:hypothetical protein